MNKKLLKEINRFRELSGLSLINEFLNNDMVSKIDGDNYIRYYINNKEIGYVEYYYDGGIFSEYLSSSEKEFYISMIEVYQDFRGNDYSSEILNNIKKYAKEKGATIITLRVDNGYGFTERQPTKGLEKIYLRNGFNYAHSEDDSNKYDLNLGAMEFSLK